MVILAVKITCKDEKINVAREFFNKFPSRARSESGCVQYDLFQARDDERIFFFFEKWATKEDFDEHSKKDYLKEFHERFGELLEKPNELLYLTEMKEK